MSAHARVQHCWTKPFKRMQHVVTRFIDHENNRNVAWSCIGSLNQIKLHATSCNIVQHRATSCNRVFKRCNMLHATMLDDVACNNVAPFEQGLRGNDGANKARDTSTPMNWPCRNPRESPELRYKACCDLLDNWPRAFDVNNVSLEQMVNLESEGGKSKTGQLSHLKRHCWNIFTKACFNNAFSAATICITETIHVCMLKEEKGVQNASNFLVLCKMTAVL